VSKIKRLFLIALILPLVLLNNCSKKTTPQKLGNISGKVFAASTSLPIIDALVSCGGVSSTTDDSGAYSLQNVPVGLRTLTTSKAGYQLYSMPVEIQGGDNPIDVYMSLDMATMGAIAFLSNRTGSNQLFVMDSDGSNQRQLTNLSLPEWWEAARSPLWSPYKQRIAFIGKLDENTPTILLINPDGTGLDTLMHVPLWLTLLGDWSKDGNQIVYGAQYPLYMPPPLYDIYLINSDGTGIEKLIGADGLPRFCRDDRVLYRALKGGFTSGNIFAINTDGSGEEQLTDTAITGVSYYYMPVASPDGRKIAFGIELLWECVHYALGLMNSDGTGDTLLTWSCGPYHGISDIEFSPDGQKILFLADNVNNSEVYVINVDGSGLTALTGDIACDRRGARWSPDGNWIVFTSNIKGNMDIYKVSADGAKTLTQLTSDPADDFCPDW
jgi:Tol biopolymer transport system component